MVWSEHERVVEWRTRSRLVDVIVETLDGWRRHLTSRNAAVLTYYGFLSIFPLFMVATTVLALVLSGNQQLQQDILDTAVAQIPVIGSQIESQAGQLEGNWWTVAVGLVIALWAATRAFAGIQTASDDTWEVSVDERDGLATKRLKGLLGIVIIGGGLIGTAALSGFAAFADLPLGGRLLLGAGTIGVNLGILLSMMRTMTSAEVTWAMAKPGAILSAIGFTVLQFAGVTLVERFLASASDTAGVFGIVFALMAWLNLHAMASLAGVELNAALVRLREGRPAKDVVAQAR